MFGCLYFWCGPVGEIILPVTQLVSSELVQELAHLNSPLQVGLGIYLAGGVNL